jgi:hypothetical protein
MARKMRFKAGSRAEGGECTSEIEKIPVASPQHEKEGGESRLVVDW